MNFQNLFKTWDYKINNAKLEKISDIWVTNIYNIGNFWFQVQDYIQRNGNFNPIIPKNNDSLWSYDRSVKPNPVKLVEKLTKFEKVELILVFHNGKNNKNPVMYLTVNEKYYKDFFYIEKLKIPEHRIKKLKKLFNGLYYKKINEILNFFYLNFLDQDTLEEWVTLGQSDFFSSASEGKILTIRVHAMSDDYKDTMTEEELVKLKEKYEV